MRHDLFLISQLYQIIIEHAGKFSRPDIQLNIIRIKNSLLLSITNSISTIRLLIDSFCNELKTPPADP